MRVKDKIVNKLYKNYQKCQIMLYACFSLWVNDDELANKK